MDPINTKTLIGECTGTLTVMKPEFSKHLYYLNEYKKLNIYTVNKYVGNAQPIKMIQIGLYLNMASY